MAPRCVLAVLFVLSSGCGRIGFDAAAPERGDARPPGIDAHVSTIDAGADDAGEHPSDAGEPPFDAREPPDAGEAPVDAGEPIVDAGSDAGVVAAADLVAWWPMNDDPSDGLADRSPTGNPSLCEGGACPASVSDPGGGASIEVSETSAYLRAGHVPAYATTAGFTVSVWVWVATWQRASFVAKLYLDAGDWSNSWQLESDGEGHASFTVNNGPGHSYGWTTASYPTESWVHLVGTWDGTTRTLYMNGVEVFEAAEPVAFDDGDVLIGADWNSSRALSTVGRIDDVRIYRRALTVAEIGALGARRE